VSQGLDLRWSSITTNPATLAGNLGARSVDFTGYTGNFSFGAFNLSVSGNANFASSGGINPGTGKLILNGTSGTQLLTPKANDTLPAIQKTGGSRVEVQTQPLRADSLHIGGGTFDLNSNNAYVQQFTAAGGAGILEGFDEATDSLIVFSRADFNGLGTLTAGLGTVALKAVGSGKNVSFIPADKPFRNVTLWTVATGGSDARVQVGAGALNVAGNLVFRNQGAEATWDGEITFLPSSANVTVGGNITAMTDGTGTNWQVVRMGNGAWKVAGSLAFPLDGGSADNSILELTGTGTQTVAVPGGSLNVVKHTGSGTVQLTSAFRADSLHLTAGILDLNGNNVTLSGDLVVDGAPNLLANLGGRTINVGGSATLKGRSGALLSLNPATAWNINVAGSFNAEFAHVANSNATGGSTGQADSNSTDGGSNINWSFGGNPAIQVPIIISEPRDTTVIEGQNASFSAASSGGGLTFIWQRIGSPDTIATGAVLNLNNLTLAQTGSLYRCIVSNAAGKDTTRQARLTVNPKPVPARVTSEPVDKLAEADGGATFSVVAEGDAPITYAWYRKGVIASVGSAKDLALTGLSLADNGALFYCIVENAHGKDTTREALLEVVPKPVPARVTTEPKDSAVFLTEKVSFTVAAEGTAPLAYQWRKKGDTATLGTDPTLAFASAKLADAGAYICIVSNGYGKDTTREALLTVKPAPVAPTIVREPADTLVKVGGTASFSAGVLGTAPLTFEWRAVGDTDLVSKDSVLSIPAVTEAMSGTSYFVVVSNSTGIKDTSSQARLTVRACDSLTTQVSDNSTVDEGANVKVWGRSVCADRTEWSVVSGPAPRLLDPSVDTLSFKAPRVAGDAVIKYLYSAWIGETVKSQEVTVTVKELIPDPTMGIAVSQVTWSGVKPLVIKPQVFNKSQLDLFTGYPLNYLWTLDPALADSTRAADSLSLDGPSGDGRMDVILCLDNGGKPACDTVHVDIDRSIPVSLARRGTLLPGGMVLRGSRLHFGEPGRVRIAALNGALLFDYRGRKDASVEIPAPALRALLGRSARLLFMR
jgi:hypothetical protein